MTVTSSRPALFVIGELTRGDGGAPVAALARIPAALLEGVDVVRGAALDVEDLMGRGRVVIVDAVQGPEPGTILTLDLAAAPAMRAIPVGSTHGLPLPAVITLASALGGRPVSGRFIGIAGTRFGIGERLSTPVRAALPRAARVIAAAVSEAVTACA